MYPFWNDMEEDEKKSIDTDRNPQNKSISYSVPYTIGSFMYSRTEKIDFTICI
jgi:hypothetical protein